VVGKMLELQTTGARDVDEGPRSSRDIFAMVNGLESFSFIIQFFLRGRLRGSSASSNAVSLPGSVSRIKG
jgi:hypothetical protein